MARPPTPAAASDARTAGRWNANRAWWRFRRTRGSTSSASSSLAGPRTTGPFHGNSRLRPLATSISPPSVRTAAAHDVGPWTSTPFASAMPPRRSFFGHGHQASYRPIASAA